MVISITREALTATVGFRSVNPPIWQLNGER